jgi:hypothetical protein
MRRIITLTLAAMLSACVPGTVRHTVVPTPAAIHSYAAACSAPVPGLTPGGYVFAGFDFVDEHCGIFFDGVIELAKDARYASSSIATANTQAALIMTAVNASLTAIAVVAAGSEMARKLIDGYAEVYAFSPYAVEVRRLAFEAMEAYRATPEVAEAIAALRMDLSGDAWCIAHNVVRNYAKICSISGVEALARQAVAHSTITRSEAPAATLVVRRQSSLVRRGQRRATAQELRTFRGFSMPNFNAGSPPR